MANHWLKENMFENIQKIYEKIENKHDIIARNEYEKMIISILLDNQMIWSKYAKQQLDPTKNYYYDMPEADKIEIIKNIWLDNKIFNWVNVSAMCGPCGKVKFMNFTENTMSEEEVVVKTRKLKECPWRNNNDELAATEIGQNIKKELEYEVLTDLKNNAGVVASCKKETLHDTIEKVASKIIEAVEPFNLSGRVWMVAGPSMAEHLKNYKVDILELFQNNCIVMGWKGNNQESGYVYSAYNPISCTPMILDPESFHGRIGFMTRYAKKLSRHGAKMFARIKMED